MPREGEPCDGRGEACLGCYDCNGRREQVEGARGTVEPGDPVGGTEDTPEEWDRAEAEQRVLDASRACSLSALRWIANGSVSTDLIEWATAELARRGLKP
jgi:hypothetical protein